MQEMEIPYPTFNEALSFFNGSNEAKNRIVNDGRETCFRDRLVTIPSVYNGHVSRLKGKFESSNAQRSQTDLPIKTQGKKIKERLVTQKKPCGIKKEATDVSQNVAKFLFFRQDAEELEIAVDAKNKMDLCIMGVRRCSTSTVATEEFGFSDQKKTSLTGVEPREPESLYIYFENRAKEKSSLETVSNDRDSVDYFSDDGDTLFSID